jgi:hypothetical protein
VLRFLRYQRPARCCITSMAAPAFPVRLMSELGQKRTLRLLTIDVRFTP